MKTSKTTYLHTTHHQSNWLRIFVLGLFMLTMPTENYGQIIPLEKDQWNTFNNDNNEQVQTRITEFKGKKALHLKRHEFAVPNIDFNTYTNFTLEFDVAAVAMPGIGFHSQDLWNFEFVFLRLNNSGQKTAVQYVPVYNGASSWQLYNYPVYEGIAEFDMSDWIHVKLKVFGDNMQIFVDHESTPNLAVKLAHDNSEAKYIFLKTSFDEAYFANITIEELETPFEVEQKLPEETYLTNWKIFEQFESELKTQFEVYRILEQKRNVRSITADEYGLVNLARYYDHPRNWAMAKTTFVSEKEQTKELLFDYSSIATIVLNGQIIFFGRELDTHNYGLVEDGEQTLSLHLKSGENTLVFLVKADDLWQEGMGNPPYLGRTQAMNWGFIARLADYANINLE